MVLPHTGILLNDEQALTQWRDPKDAVLGERTRHKKTTQCGALDRKCPEQENPETEGGFVGPRGWGEWKIKS